MFVEIFIKWHSKDTRVVIVSVAIWKSALPNFLEDCISEIDTDFQGRGAGMREGASADGIAWINHHLEKTELK